jgi:T4 RnlA family RNA ligase
MIDLESPAIRNFYRSLLNICTNETPFFYKDEEVIIKDQVLKVRVFTYRLAKWGDFDKYKPHSYWCRGTTFDITDITKVRLVSLPLRKFFNLNECPDTMYNAIKHKKIAWIAEKLDGSLISNAHFEVDGKIYTTTKTKQTFHSSQALSAQRLSYYNHDSFFDYEYISPDNRIVIPYEKEELRPLESRSLDDNDYKDIYEVYKDIIIEQLPELKSCLRTTNLCEHKMPQKMSMSSEYYNKTLEDFDVIQKYITGNTSSEGVVITFQDGQKVKVKTDWYSALHRLRDSINNKKYLLEVILTDGFDDIISKVDDVYKDELHNLFFKIQRYITEKEYNIDRFHILNYRLTRKDYAIKAKQEMTGKLEFNTCMSLYVSGKYTECNFQQIMLDNIDKFVHENNFIFD